MGLVRCADQAERSVPLEHREIGIEVVRRGHGVEDEIEPAAVALHLLRVPGDDHLVGAKPPRILRLAQERS